MQIAFPQKRYTELRVPHQRLANYSCYEARILLKHEALTAFKAYLNVVLQQHAHDRLLVRNYDTGTKARKQQTVPSASGFCCGRHKSNAILKFCSRMKKKKKKKTCQSLAWYERGCCLTFSYALYDNRNEGQSLEAFLSFSPFCSSP